MPITWQYAYYMAICLLPGSMPITWPYAYYMAICLLHGNMPITYMARGRLQHTPGQRPNAVHTWPEAECRVPGLARGRMPDAEPPSQHYYNTTPLPIPLHKPTPHHTNPHTTPLHHTTPHRTSPHNTPLHHTAPHHTTPHLYIYIFI